jgi:3-hydroxyisobutyrate dehydrogenase-like beta-hydroxyacid dehydrogenase
MNKREGKIYMDIQTVGILSPGDMGHAIGARLQQHGLRVITSLAGRSARTAALAQEAGIVAVADDATLVREADILLSILPPARAYGFAERIASVLRQTGATLLFVDCNAIAPGTAQAIEQVITEAGGAFVDACIIGSPPKIAGQGPRLYLSGSRAADVAGLQAYGLEMRVLGSRSGQASGLKMCYASVTKGLTALLTGALVAGKAMDLQEALLAEFQELPYFASSQRSVIGMPPKAYRWVGEMEEIGRTFADLGLPPQMPEGAAAIYRFIEGTVLGNETPEQRQHGQTLEEIMSILADALE